MLDLLANFLAIFVKIPVIRDFRPITVDFRLLTKRPLKTICALDTLPFEDRNFYNPTGKIRH